MKENLLAAIPFFDFLLGFSAIGHRVWVYEGHSSALAAGCRDADLLLVDAAMAAILDAENPDWRKQAQTAMRGETIRVVARPK